MLFNPGQTMVALVISLAMIATVLMANIIGGALPMLAKLCRIDPATMAAPLVTTIVDALSLLIFFSLSVAMLAL